MDTLSRDITRRFFASEDGFLALQRHWRQMVNAPDCPRLLAEHYLLYQVARGKDYRRGFTLPTNAVKVANGQLYGSGLRVALQLIHDAARRGGSLAARELLAPFAGTLTLESLAAIAETLPRNDHGWVRLEDVERGYVEREVACAA